MCWWYLSYGEFISSSFWLQYFPQFVASICLPKFRANPGLWWAEHAGAGQLANYTNWPKFRKWSNSLWSFGSLQDIINFLAKYICQQVLNMYVCFGLTTTKKYVNFKRPLCSCVNFGLFTCRYTGHSRFGMSPGVLRKLWQSPLTSPEEVYIILEYLTFAKPQTDWT